jgi:hypothetical protein
MGFIGDMFGSGQVSTDNSGAYNQFANAMRGLSGNYQPWIDTGNQARGITFDQYQQLMNNPNAVQDKVAAGFNMSPYQNYMENQATKQMNYNAANTGMLGSGAANRALQQELVNMTGGFENDYINRGMQSYGMGLQGMGHLTDMGYQALGDQTAINEGAAGADLQGQMSHNQHEASQQARDNSGWGNLIGTGLAVGGAILGGPAGATVGQQIGRGMTAGSNSMYQPAPSGSPMSGSGQYNTGNWSY